MIVYHTVKKNKGHGRVAKLVRVLSLNTKAVGSVSGQGTYKNQPMNV